MKIKAIIFDLDGTIVDSEKPYRKFWPIAFKQFGLDLNKQQNLDLRSLGDPYLTKTLYKWYGKFVDYKAIEKIAMGLEKKYYQTHKLKVKRGIKKSLAYLKSKGYLIAVATSSYLWVAQRRLKEVKLDKYVDKVISACCVKKGKPGPDVYKYVLKQLKLKPHEVLAVEDSPNGVASSTGAKIFTILIPDIVKQTIKNNKLVKVIDSGDELIKTINKLNHSFNYQYN